MDNNDVGAHGGNICFSKAGLAQSVVTAGALNIVNNVRFSIDGITYELAAVNNAPFSAGHTTLAAGCECLFGLWVDNGNNITLITIVNKIMVIPRSWPGTILYMNTRRLSIGW